MKYIVKVLVLVIIAAILLSLCACGKKNEISGEQALEIYVWDAGYGISWMEANIENFKQQDWVKQKYPNLQVKLITNDQNNYAETRITAGSANTIDLFYATSLNGLFENDCINLADLVYNAEIPGEGILYKDKLQDYALDNYGYRDDLGKLTGEYYTAAWAAGLTSFIYNQTLFDELGLRVPNTTDELIALCQTVKDMDGSNPAYPYSYSIISSKIMYSDRLPVVWWTQYDGLEGYRNYFNAISADGTRNSADIFEEKGRLEATKVFESLYKQELGYYDRSSTNYEFIQGQTRMLTGEGLMMVCGEWFSAEMRDLAVEYIARGYDYNIRMMKLPVISSIIDKTSTIKDDEMLSQVVADIDAGLTAPSNTAVSIEDFEIVRMARGVFTTKDSMNHNVVIPKSSDAQTLAADFLLYMASDDALKIYAENTYGGVMPFQYDIESDFPELHQKMMSEYGITYAVLYDCAKMLNTEYANGAYTTSVLAKYGSFDAWLSKYNNLERVFMSDSEITAEQIIAEHKEYWLGNNAYNFQNALSRAGLS